MSAKKRMVLCLACLMIYPVVLMGIDYYVDGANGSDSKDGKSLANAWKTINKANQTLDKGDKALIRGGTYYTTSTPDWGGDTQRQGIRPVRSGQPGSPITYQNYNNEYVFFKGTTFGGASYAERPYGVDLNGVSYIVVKGLHFYFMFHQLYITNGSHNEIAYCSFDGMFDVLSDWNGSCIHKNSQYNWIHHSTISNYGNSLGGSDFGVTLEVGNEGAPNEDPNVNYHADSDFTSNNLIEACHIFHGGHHVIGFNGCYNILRNCYVHNEAWMPDEGGTLWGNRCLNFCTDPNYTYCDKRPDPGIICNKRNLVDNCRIGYSYRSVDAPTLTVEGNKIASPYNIIRRSLIYQHESSALSHQFYGCTSPAKTGPPYGNSLYNHEYNNTIYKTDTENYRGDIYFNAFNVSTFQRVGETSLKNNIILAEGRAARIYPDLDDTCGSNCTGICNTCLHNTIENNFLSGNPLWVTAPVIPASAFEPQPDFLIQSGSPCRNAGAFLTTITSAGGTGTQFVVADAGYFMDGWGMMEGDLIQLQGQAQTARITNVNYDNNTIAVNTALTWTQGLGIALAYEGTAPDIGAYEYGLTQALPPADTTPPIAPAVVRDGTDTDINSTLSTTQLSANWDAAVELESSITRYFYTIGTAPGSTDIVSWTDNGTSTKVTKTGLSLQVLETHYFSVKAQNSEGLIGDYSSSDGQIVLQQQDTTPPSAPAAVRDGTSGTTDSDSTDSTVQLSANWDASTDPESNIAKYYFAIGTTAGGTDTLDWTDNGTNTAVTKSGVSLTVGVIYYFSVKAENNSDLKSSITSSNGQSALGQDDDATAPSDILSVRDGTGADVNSINSTNPITELSANWDASVDSESGISRYYFAISSSPGTTNITNWTDIGNTTRVTKTGLNLAAGTTYYFSVKSENGVSLQSNPANSNGQFFVVTSTGTTLPPPGTTLSEIRVYPNPHNFNNGTPMTFTVGNTTGVELKIFTINGKLIRKSAIPAGTNKIDWDGRNEDGEKVARGIYIYCIYGSNGDSVTGKLGVTR